MVDLIDFMFSYTVNVEIPVMRRNKLRASCGKMQ